MKGITARSMIRASRWCLPLAIVVGVVLVAGPSWATHYPPGSYCYDCHTVSESKMIVGTRLIKKSQKAIDLGISSGAEVPCLFCHEKNAVSVPNRTVMMDVWSHFDTNVRSKHPVDMQSTSGGNPGGFDCLDCHTGISATVVGDGTGNASIHGVDASAGALDPYPTLIGTPANATELSAKTCQNAACHDVDGGGAGDYNAPAAHPTASGITLNDGAAPAECTDCHGKHYSADGDSLLVLLNTSGANGNAPTNVTVQADECEVCHDADDGGAASDWMAHGHGGSTYQSAAIGLNCLSCHDAAKPHVWNGTDKRFSLPADTATSTVTGKALTGVCTNCHQTLTAHRGQAGCLDCHDPHGKGVGANIEMVRQQIPVASPTDTVTFQVSGVYDTGAPSFDYFRTDTGGPSSSSTGVCDNADCHGGVISSANGTTPIHPLSGLMTGGNHSGADQTVGVNCSGCHTHGDTTGSWGASAACDKCHGYPPNNTDPYVDNTDAVGVHDTHVTSMGFGCQQCHNGNTHNESNWATNTGIPIPTGNVQVAFDPTRNPNGTYSKTTNTCSNLTCHNPDDTVDGVANGAATGTNRQTDTNNNPQWLDTFAAINVCTDCHGSPAAADATPDATPDSHYPHDYFTQKAYPCQVCHAGENASTNSYSGGHGDGELERRKTTALPPLVNFDLTQAGLFGAPGAPDPYDAVTSTCTNVYCHGSSLPLSGTDQTPVWGDQATGGVCGTCHKGANIGTGNHTDHLSAAYGPGFGAACSNCHTNSTISPGSTHVDGRPTFANVDIATFASSPLGALAVTAPTATDTDRCTACHSTATVNGQVGTVLAKANWTNGSFTLGCLNCHNGADPATNNADGTGRLAPDMLGDDTTYGAEVTGHNRPTGQYPVSANTAAGRACTDCHDATTTHLNNADDTTYAGNRLLTTINATATGSTVSGACNACHATAGASPASNKSINTHGNTGYAGNLENQAGSTGGANAFAAGCDQCHEPHGRVSNGTDVNIYMINPTVTVAAGTTVGNVRLSALTGTGSFNDGVGGDDLCVVCHTNAANPGFGMTHNSDGNHAAPNYTTDERGTDCSSCHVHNQDNTLATVDGLMPVACDSCHGYPPATNAHDKHVNVAAIDCARCHQNAGAHNESAVTGAADYASRGLTAIRQNVDVVFDAFNPSGAYSQAKGARTGLGDGTCSVLYCHGDDAVTFPANNGGTDTTPEWNNAATGACGVCHGATATSAPRTNAHLKHTSSNEYGYGCNLCHVATTSDGTTITTVANHVDQLVQVAFDTTDPRLDANSLYGGDTVVGSGYGACTQTYCHSQGNDRVAPFGQFAYTRQKGVSGPFTPVPWDSTNSSCSKCHGSRPDYVDLQDIDGTPKGNKHEKHVGENLYSDCGACHYTTFNGNGGNFNTATHVNMTYNVDVNSAVTTADLGYFTFAAGTGGVNGSCATANCHGGRSSIAWAYDVVVNGNFTCDVCHATTAGVPSTTDVNDFSWNNTGSQSKIDPSDYNASGHGAKALVCAACHDSTVSHNSYTQALQPHTLDGANPFRLVDQDAGTTGVQFSCSFNNAACHPAGANGPRTGLDLATIVPHTDEAMATAGYTAQRTWPAWNPECVNCHDPHGDGANLSMIQREVYDKAAFILPAGPPPAAPTEQTNLVFTDDTTGANTAGTSYADLDTPFSSVCQECHEAADHVSFKDDTTAAGANHPATGTNPGDCSTCHKHDSAFKPSGCNGCHGSTVTGQYWPDGVPGSPAYADDSPGSAAAHDSHMLAIGQYLGYGDFHTTMYTGSQQTTICSFCHDSPGGGGHTNNTVGSPVNQADVIGDGFSAGTFTAFDVAAQATRADANGAGSYDQAAKTCANVDCHYENSTPTYAGAGWDGADTGAPNCETCHYYRDGGTYPTVVWAAGDLPDAHQVHVAGVTPPAANQSHGYLCSYCHDVTGYTTAHTNGAIDLSVALNPTINKDGNPADEAFGGGSATVKYGAGTAATTCTNFYCHGADFGAATQGTNVAPVWNDHTTAFCSTCHDVDTRPAPTLGQEFTQGKHKTHASPGAPYLYGPPYSQHAPSCTVCHGVEDNSTGFQAGCGADACHPGGGMDTPGSASDAGFSSFPTREHVDGTFEVDFEGNLARGWNDISDYTGTPGTLAVLGATAGTGTDICNRCHTTVSVNGVVGATLAKQNWTTASYRLPCLNCHNGSAYSSPVTGGVAAPNMFGDDVNYGAEVNGHSLASGNFTGSGNPAANKACTVCHDATVAHIDGTDGTAMADNRFAATINGVAVGAATQVEQICQTCHQNTGGDQGQQVSTHGNTNATFQAGTTHDTNAENFAYRCDGCHEPHGLTVNSRTPGTNVNIYMVKPSVEVKNYSTPGTGAETTTTLPVVFEARTGTYSLDDGNTTPLDSMCVVCHQSASRPGSGTALTNAAGDGTHTGLSDYSTSEQGNHCTACHQHDYDANAGGTVDGFMPLQCDGCHSYPPTTNAHTRHAGAAPTNYAFNCSKCHSGNTHNESGVTSAAEFAALNAVTLANNVDVNFDATNPTGSYAPAKGSRVASGAGTCSSLYCHGADAPFPTATMGGTDTTPTWNTPGTGACGTCHLDTTATWNGKGSNRHQTHVGTVGTYNFGCDLCHYATTTDGATITGPTNHVDGLATVAFSASDPRLNTTLAPVSTYTGDTVVGSGYGTCDNTYCHSRGRDFVPPFEDTPASATMTWDSSSGSCSHCHDGPISGGPGYADGTLVDGSPKANKHPKHQANGTGCASCHGWFSTAFTTYHVNGQYDPTGGTNNTLDTFTFTRGTTAGGINGTCSSVGCHGGNNVAWADTGPFACDICHGEVGGVATNIDVNDFAIGMQSAGSVMSNIGASEFTGVGHGGKGLACTSCHDSGTNHDSNADLSGANPFRLVDQDAGTAGVQFSCSYNNAACHQGTTAGGLDYQSIVVHTDEAMATAGYTAARTWPAWNPDCVNCHDPHGDGSNLSMIQRELYDKAAFNLPAGPPPAEPTEQTGLAFTDNTTGADSAGTSYADLDTPFSAVCQECHEAIDHVSFKDDTSAAGANHPATGSNPGDCSNCHKHDSAFMPSGCNGCHGYPPVPAARAGEGGNTDYVAENYTGGGGKHIEHVEFLKAQTGNSTDVKEICGPCHGDGAGSTDHQGSGQATGAWAIANRAFVNLRSRAQSSWDGMTGDPLSATYGGSAVNTTGTTPPGNAVDATDSRCAGVDCHGNPAATEPVYWNADMTDTVTYNDGLTKSQVCEGCHDETPAEVRVYNAAGAGVYTGSAPDPAASYFGTLSGYSRGGHGDATINSTNDPSFVDSAPSYTTPLDCTACHDSTVAHFPEPASGNIHRLANTTLETTSHTGLCNDCHASGDYPGNHHPSYEGTLASSTTDVIPAALQEVYTTPSTWTDQGGGHYEQNGYQASGWNGNADFFTDWWGGNPANANQDPPPQPSPLAVLPLERYVLATGTSTRVMCVTCHNPHGTDLYTYDTLGGHQSVPDNNMLRLRDSDNTLCNACH